MKSKIIYVDFDKKHKITFIMYWFNRFVYTLTSKFKSTPKQNEKKKNSLDNVKQLFN